MTEIEKVAIEFCDAHDETILCVYCRDDYICLDHRDRYRSAFQALRNATREMQKQSGVILEQHLTNNII